MSKWMAVAALGVAMICGCDSMKKKDSTTQPQKMSTSGSSAKCTACDAPAAKAK